MSRTHVPDKLTNDKTGILTERTWDSWVGMAFVVVIVFRTRTPPKEDKQGRAHIAFKGFDGKFQRHTYLGNLKQFDQKSDPRVCRYRTFIMGPQLLFGPDR